MSGEIIHVQENRTLPLTKQDLADLKEQRELLKKFVKSQLKQGIDDDYAVIPGTKKKTLLKPGAEKLLKLFGLGVRMKLVEKEIDRYANFALFIYRAEIYHLRSNALIAECEGSANSQEVKYRSRKVFRDSGNRDAKGNVIKEQVEEETPVCDVLNTLMKMAQKRAYVGGTILAVGASDFFNQDTADGLTSEAKKPRAEAEDQAAEAKDEVAPSCCGQPMMISKYEDKDLGGFPWYCIKCKKKEKR